MSADTIEKRIGIKDIWARFVSLFTTGEKEDETLKEMTDEERNDVINADEKADMFKEVLKNVETKGKGTQEPINAQEKEKIKEIMSTETLEKMRQTLSGKGKTQTKPVKGDKKKKEKESGEEIELS